MARSRYSLFTSYLFRAWNVPHIISLLGVFLPSFGTRGYMLSDRPHPTYAYSLHMVIPIILAYTYP